MVFWSSWAKKVRESINKLTFDRLKNRVDIIESDYATKTYTDQQDTTLSNRITDNTNRIIRIETELGDANFVLYMGPWNATETYKKGLAVTEGDLWYVSNVNNNLNHRPSGVSDQYWKLITSPSINLNDYYTKTESDNRFAGVNKTNYFLVPQYIKGSLNLGADNSNPRIEIDGENRRISALSGRIQYQNCATPTLSDDCANKEYVDNNFYNKTQADAKYAQKGDISNLQGQINTTNNNVSSLSSNLSNNYYTKTQINNWDLQTYSGTLTQLLVGPQKGDTTGTGGFPIYKYAFKTSIRFNEQDWSNMCVLDFRFVNAQRQWVYVNPLFVFLDNGYINIEFITLDPNCYQTNTGAQVQIRVIKNSSYIG